MSQYDSPEPNWPAKLAPPPGSPNVLLVMLDDVGFSDFGCYGSEIETPTIDGLADKGVRYSGFHTTAMCSTTRAALLTGRNHHAVGVGCLANFDSGFPGYRGKISHDAPTIAETLRTQGYRNYMVGKWHVTPLTETGPTGPFDGWPLGRGFDRFYGFMDAETDQYSPELVMDNSHIEAPGTFESGYHLTEDLFEHAIRNIRDHIAALPTTPWFMMITPGACHAPHQAPKDLVDKYQSVFSKGWDTTREDRLARQIKLGITPEGTELPSRNDRVQPWIAHSEEEQQVFGRLAGAYAGMLEHTDTHLGRLVNFLTEANIVENTLILVLSDNGASQEGGPNGFLNAMGPFNGRRESMEEKFQKIEEIGGPKSHSNFPWGWAMASNTPLKRYKQNTHGGGIRDPLVISWPEKISSVNEGAVRHQFCHVSDLAPTIFELIGLDMESVTDSGTTGVSFASTINNSGAVTGKTTQYFEMFGHRGIIHEDWKAVAYHEPGTAFEDDIWELYDLSNDFNELSDLSEPEALRLEKLKDLWWTEAESNQVLPLDDRFGPRFAENAERHRGGRTNYSFWPGMGHLPSDVAPDLRSRSYAISATVELKSDFENGVLIAHGDATGGYSFYFEDGFLCHDMNIGGDHEIVKSAEPLSVGRHDVSFQMKRIIETTDPNSRVYSQQNVISVKGEASLIVDGAVVGTLHTDRMFFLMVSWSGLDIGFDRGSPVGTYEAPFNFTAKLIHVTVDLEDDQELDYEGVGKTEMARE